MVFNLIEVQPLNANFSLKLVELVPSVIIEYLTFQPLTPEFVFRGNEKI